MNRLIAEWLWRVAMLATTIWIAMELHQIHLDLIEPADSQTTAAAEPGDLQGSLDGLRDDVAAIDQKVAAIMQAMLQLKR